MTLPPAARRAILIVFAALALAYAVWLIAGAKGNDFLVYRAGAQALLDGQSVYDVTAGPNGNAFTYPPFAAFIYIPIALLPIEAGRLLVGIVSVAALFGCARIIGTRFLPLAGSKLSFSPWTITWIAFAVALFMEPTTETIRFCQPNLALLFLLLLDTTSNNRWTGVLTGVAAGFKVTPGIFIVLMLLTRRWMDALRAVAAFAATLLIGALFGIGQEWYFWTSALFDTERVGDSGTISNASINGVLARLSVHGDQYSLAFAAVVLIVGMTLAVFWWQRSQLISATIVGTTGLLISPISWIHHFVWLIPALWVLVALAIRAGVSRRPGLCVLITGTTLITALITLTGARRTWPKIFGPQLAEIGSAAYAFAALLALAVFLLTMPLIERKSLEGVEQPS